MKKFLFRGSLLVAMSMALLLSCRAMGGNPTPRNAQRKADPSGLSGGIAQPVPSATASLRYTLPPDLLAKAITLGRLRVIFAFGVPAWSILILLAVLALRWQVRLRDWVERSTRRWWVQGAIFVSIAIVFLVLLPLPFEIYGHHIGLAYGLSVQSWGGWTLDQLKMLLLSLIVFVPLLLLLFLVVRRAPRSWWLWFWAGTLPVIVFGVFISPMWIDPMFNHFSPLQQSDPKLVVQLEALAHHAQIDIPPSRMFLMRASDKVTGLNAYVTGIGASKRIVVWDNTVRELPTDQILFITGHEMGHYALNHIYKGLAFTALLMLGLLGVAYIAAQWLAHRFGARWGIRGLDDWAALGIFVLIFILLNSVSSPIANSFSRWEEHQADIYGMEAIHGLVADPQQTATRAFTALGRTYLEAPDPNPWVEFWLDSHPSTSQRVDFAEQYDPWLPGRHPRYFHRQDGEDGRNR